MNELSVLLYGRVVGRLAQDRNGRHRFTYASDAGPLRLSRTMPPSKRDYRHRVIEPFIEGLLPDNPRVREAEGVRLGVSGGNPFALLGELGLDCAGAVQFCAPDRVDEVMNRSGSLIPQSRGQIAERLRLLRMDDEVSRVLPGESYSIAGWQAKFALRKTDDGWAEAVGAEPTTHIVKPGVASLELEALTEHVSMDAARRLGLAAARTEYVEFDDQPAIVVERYDREVSPDGSIRRLHQEDFCQALGVFPQKKYERLGGPHVTDLVDVVHQVCPPGDVERLTQAVAFSYVIGASDGHAKNFSLLISDAGDFSLAPLYDVATVLFYEPHDRRHPHRLAFAIGGESVFGHILDRHWETFARAVNVPSDQVIAIVHDLAERAPDAMADAFATMGMRADGMAKVVMPQIERLCWSARHSRNWEDAPIHIW
ncbi:MAG: HipA domain-containing protein [Propionibacteriaceae bacterium]|jgi:serine/threonine-protein kinase HipA|nr:HipA domain-containing protein [Propionibacteriaceae bacterium]